MSQYHQNGAAIVNGLGSTGNTSTKASSQFTREHRAKVLGNPAGAQEKIL